MTPPPAAPSNVSPDAVPPSALLRFMQAYLRFAIEDVSALLKQHRLSVPQLGALQFLRAEGPQTVSAIAEHLGLSRTATSHLVDRLVRKNLVERREDPDDRRQKRVTLGDRGHDLIAETHRRAAESLAALLDPVPERTRDALEQAMRDVVTGIEAASPQGPA